jgi:hypothetical protein
VDRRTVHLSPPLLAGCRRKCPQILRSFRLRVRIEDMRLEKMWLALGLALASSRAEDKPVYTFGTTVVDSGGLQGRVYHLKPGTQMPPNFGHVRPVGSVYTTSLNVWPQNFDEGFPSITNRFEWFAIEYSGRFWVENAGHYRFSLLADDGAKLYLHNEVVIDNDGVHRAMAISGGATPRSRNPGSGTLSSLMNLTFSSFNIRMSGTTPRTTN